MDLADRSGNSVVCGKIGHITLHSLPIQFLWYRYTAVWAMFMAWWIYFDKGTKLRAVLFATAYSFIEHTFTRVVSDGVAFTSFGQWWANVLLLPGSLDLYATILLNNAEYPSWLYVAAFPLNIWLLELIQTVLFAVIYGRNVAWCYCTYDDRYFRGAIRTGHGVYWLALGAFLYVTYPAFNEFTNAL